MIDSTPNRPVHFDERFRLYLDESGDHVYRKMADLPHRFLCLLGCWFKNPAYLDFHGSLERLKSKYFPNHPDNPVILHREDIINKRGPFKSLQAPAIQASFDRDLLELIQTAQFAMIAVVIDKYELWRNYGDAAQHPYHLGLAFMLQRYCGYLNHINRVGDVMAEGRGKSEDQLLSFAYTTIYEHGAWMTPAHTFQSALTSRSLKISPKRDNISGLQLADILGHPVKQWVLKQHGLTNSPLAPFAHQLIPLIEPKFNRQIYQNRVEGYGTVLYPKNKKTS